MEIRKFYENPRNSWTWWRVPGLSPKCQILKFLSEKSQKISCKTFYWKTLVCLKPFLFTTKIVWGDRFLFLIWSKPLDCTLSEDFGIWQDPFALQIDIKGNSVAKNTKIWYLSKNTILHFSVKYQFGTKCRSSCSRAVFKKRFYFFSTKDWSFFGFQCIFKQVKTKRKIFRQSWTKHLPTFLLFSKISLHHKWNGTRLLSPESECTRCLTSGRIIEDLES